MVYHVMEAKSVSSPSLIRLLQVLFFLTCTVSVLSILALTLERFYAISKPFKYRQCVTKSRVFLASGMIWILSPGFLMPYFVMGYRTFSFVFANVVILVTLCTLIYALFQDNQNDSAQKKHSPGQPTGAVYSQPASDLV